MKSAVLITALATVANAAVIARSETPTVTSTLPASVISRIDAAHTQVTWWEHSKPAPAPTEPTGHAEVVESTNASPVKRGLSYNNGNYLKFFSTSKINWAYNWYSAPGSPFPSNLKYIPMLWSNQGDLTSVWNQNAQKAITSYNADSILSFNEPDDCQTGNSACMSVSAAVSTYKQYIQPFVGKVRLGAPAVTNGGSPMGLTWLSQFLSACSGCTIDFVPVHWYASAYSIDYFKSYMQQAHQTAGRNIWITEFGMDNTYPEADVNSFLQQALAFIDQTSWIERAAWFGTFTNNTVNVQGTGLSALGQTYNSYSG